MGNKKKTLEKIMKQFSKHKILKVNDLKVDFPGISERTFFRYLVALDYIASYTHAGRYYTLQSLANFDKNGLWKLEEAGFSKHGTLKSTTFYLIDCSVAGKTHAELEMQLGIRVHNTLLELVKSKMIHRERFQGAYLYLSRNEERLHKQLKQRYAEPEVLPSGMMVIEILVCVIRASSSLLIPEVIFSKLQKQGSSVTLGQVRRVFQEYDLKKKTPDCAL